MNRRSFLSRLVAGVIGAVVAPHLALSPTPTPLFTELVPAGAVGDFEVVMYWQYEMLCDSPRSLGLITDLTE